MCGRRRRRLRGVALVAAGCAVFSGCAAIHGGGTTAKSLQPSSGVATSGTARPPGPGAVSVSPGGVTTDVDVPAASSEEEYGQACKAAKVWMDQHGGDPRTLIEPYLATLQAPGAAVGTATFNTSWAQLAPARQAAVIVAVRAAASAQCG